MDTYLYPRFMNKLIVIILCTFMGILGANTDATEQSLQLGMTLRGEHIDNVQLETRRKDYLASTIISPKIDYRSASPSWLGNVHMSTNIRTTSDADFDSDDQSYIGSLKRSWQHSSISTEISRMNTTVRQVEAIEALRVTNDPVITHGLNTVWQYQFSIADTWLWSAQYLQRDYQSEIYTDYADWRVEGLWQHSLNEIFSLQGQVNYGEYDSDRIDLAFTTVPKTYLSSKHESATVGTQIGLFGKATNRLSYNLLFGTSNTDVIKHTAFQLEDSEQTQFQLSSTSTASTSSTFSASLEYHSEYSQLRLLGSKGLRASGGGVQFDTQSLSLTDTRRLTERCNLNINISFSKQQPIGTASVNASGSEREIATVSLGVSKRLVESWSLSVIMNYVEQRYKIQRDTAESVTGIIQLRYAPKLITW